MYWIQFLLTRQCNQKCSYCTTRKPQEDNVEVDLDFLDYVLSVLPSDLGVEITGGEIGLVDNLNSVFEKVYRKTKKIIVLSNGLVRLLGVDWLSRIEYWEHLIKEIEDKNIIKFYDLDLKGNHKYIVVTTEKTTKSLLKNWSYFSEMGLFKNNFFYKLMNHKSPSGFEEYSHELIRLYSNLKNNYFLTMILSKNSTNLFYEERKLCETFSPNQFIDFETKTLGHCAVNINISNRWPFSEEILDKLMNGKLYNGCSYCKSCVAFDFGKERTAMNNRVFRR